MIQFRLRPGEFERTFARETDDGDETLLRVRYAYEPGFKGSWDEPAYGPSIEVLEVLDADGKPTELTKEELSYFEDAAIEDAEDDQVGEYERYVDNLRDDF